MFIDRGVAADRVEVRSDAANPSEYLRLYNDIDIHLDAMPWSGHVTTCESLLMGVPMVTLYGTRSAGRLSASILQSIGFEGWIARTTTEFVQAAARLAEDFGTLSQIRSALRRKMRGSSLCDGESFCRRLESEYRHIWRKWCSS